MRTILRLPSYLACVVGGLTALTGLVALIAFVSQGKRHPLAIILPLVFIISGGFLVYGFFLRPVMDRREEHRDMLAFQKGLPIRPILGSTAAGMLLLLMVAAFTIMSWLVVVENTSFQQKPILILAPLAPTLLTLWLAYAAVRFIARKRCVRSWRLCLAPPDMQPGQWADFTVNAGSKRAAEGSIRVLLRGIRWTVSSGGSRLWKDTVHDLDGDLELEPSSIDTPSVIRGRLRLNGVRWNGDNSLPGSWIEPRLLVECGRCHCEFPLPLTLQSTGSNEG
ncbi:MAG: hypothetical protein GXY74_05075 [Phycisphaerae bacterium]|nr:hypothetical protein [Phycisphaerae bacterium]